MKLSEYDKVIGTLQNVYLGFFDIGDLRYRSFS